MTVYESTLTPGIVILKVVPFDEITSYPFRLYLKATAGKVIGG